LGVEGGREGRREEGEGRREGNNGTGEVTEVGSTTDRPVD
jgi:hypothetical protein